MAGNANSYVLSFDFSEITRQISELQSKYAELSSDFSSMSDQAVESVKNLQEAVNGLNTALEGSINRINSFYSQLNGGMKGLERHFSRLSDHSQNISKNIGKLSRVNLKNLQGDETAADRMATISGDDPYFKMQMSINAATDKVADSALKKAESAIKAARKAIEESKTSIESIKSYAQREVDGLKKTMASRAKGVLPPGISGGGLLGGLLGLMIWGVHESQRKDAEKAEMQNVVATAGGIFEKGTQKAITKLADFQEHAQRQLNITRKEIQGIVGQLTSMGIKIDERLVGTSKEIWTVNENVITTTLALDKFFNMSTGTSMNRTLDVVRNYGVSYKNATEQIKKLSFQAQRSGMDIQKFVGTVMSGASATAQYGFELKDVSEILTSIQENYKAMGINPQKAGTFAAQATGAVMSGIANLPEGLAMNIANRIYGSKNALADLHRMRKTLFSGNRTERDQVKVQMLRHLDDMANESAAGAEDPETVRVEMLKQYIPNLSTVGAQAFSQVLRNLKLPKGLGGLTEDQKKLFDDTFKRKGAELTDLQKAQKDLFEGLADIGKGLLQAAVGLIGAVTLGFKSVVAGVTAAALKAKGQDAQAELVWKDLDRVYAQLEKLGVESMQNLEKGGVKVGGSIGDAIKSISEPFMSFMNFDPLKYSGMPKEYDRFMGEVDFMIDSAMEEVDFKFRDFNDRFSSNFDDVMRRLGVLEADEQTANSRAREIKREDQLRERGMSGVPVSSNMQGPGTVDQSGYTDGPGTGGHISNKVISLKDSRKQLAIGDSVYTPLT